MGCGRQAWGCLGNPNCSRHPGGATGQPWGAPTTQPLAQSGRLRAGTAAWFWVMGDRTSGVRLQAPGLWDRGQQSIPSQQQCTWAPRPLHLPGRAPTLSLPFWLLRTRPSPPALAIVSPHLPPSPPTASVIPEVPSEVTAAMMASEVGPCLVTEMWWVMFFSICSSSSRSRACRSPLLTNCADSFCSSQSREPSCWSLESRSLTVSRTWASTL